GFAAHEGFITLADGAGMHEIDLVAPHEAFEHSQRRVVGSLMELHADSFAGEADRRAERGLGAHKHRLVHRGGTPGDDRPLRIVDGAADLTPFARAIDVRLALLECLLIVRRADQMMIPAARVVPIEFRLDAGRNDLDFETLLLGGVVARDEPVQSEHRLGAFDHELRAITNHRRHCFALLVLSSRGIWAAGMAPILAACRESVYSILFCGSPPSAPMTRQPLRRCFAKPVELEPNP